MCVRVRALTGFPNCVTKHNEQNLFLTHTWLMPKLYSLKTYYDSHDIVYLSSIFYKILSTIHSFISIKRYYVQKFQFITVCFSPPYLKLTTVFNFKAKKFPPLVNNHLLLSQFLVVLQLNFLLQFLSKVCTIGFSQEHYLLRSVPAGLQCASTWLKEKEVTKTLIWWYKHSSSHQDPAADFGKEK